MINIRGINVIKYDISVYKSSYQAQVQTCITLTAKLETSVCRKLSGHVGIGSHCSVSSFSVEIDPCDLCDVPTCGRLSVFPYLSHDCTLLIPSFNSGTASSLPLLLLFLTVSAAAALVLSAPSPCAAPSGWRVSMVCNDSVLSAGFQIDTPDTLGRTCLHAAAAGG